MSMFGFINMYLEELDVVVVCTMPSCRPNSLCCVVSYSGHLGLLRCGYQSEEQSLTVMSWSSMR
jgi:hypothetical protein